MKKRYILFGVLLALTLSLCCFAMIGCGDGEAPTEQTPEITERLRYSDATNPFAELTWQEYIDLFATEEQTGAEYWAEKQASDKIYYQFEGSYSEAYQGDYSRTFLYMNCYEDGSLHATYGEENYYGFWTNVDKRGNTSFVLHIVRYNNGEYNDGIYESVCNSYDHKYYEYSSTIIWNKWGTRTVLIFGGHYSPVKSIAVSGAKSEYKVGDSFSTSGTAVTVTRENGKSIDIDEQSFPQKDCRIKFDGFDGHTEGKQTITVSHVYSDVSATFDINVVGIQSLAINTTAAKKEFYVGDSLDTTGLTVTATFKDDTQATIAVNRCEITGFDSESAVDEQTITVGFEGLSQTYNIEIVAPVYRGTATYTGGSGEIKIKVSSPSVCELEYDGKTAKLNYKIIDAFDTKIYSLANTTDTPMVASEWNGLHKQYTFNRDALTLEMATPVYEIPSFPENVRAEQEPMPGIGGNTELRYILIDQDAQTATITYKYWYKGQTDTFICKYTLVEKVLTLTECIESTVGAFNSSFDNLYKTWTLGDNFQALKYVAD